MRTATRQSNIESVFLEQLTCALQLIPPFRSAQTYLGLFIHRPQMVPHPAFQALLSADLGRSHASMAPTALQQVMELFFLTCQLYAQ